MRDGREYRLGNQQDGTVLRAPLVFLGAGTRADYEAAGDVRGKTVLILRDDNKMGWVALAALEATVQGASAVILYGETGEGTVLPEALRQDPVTYEGLIPAFSIRRVDGERLRAELERRTLEVELSCEAEERDGESVNVLGWLRGTRFPEEVIMVSAHLDRWFTGCQDNSAGAAQRATIPQHSPPTRTKSMTPTRGSTETGVFRSPRCPPTSHIRIAGATSRKDGCRRGTSSSASW